MNSTGAQQPRHVRERQQNWLVATAIVVALSVAGLVGVGRALDQGLVDVRRELSLTSVLADPDDRFVNYLVVGSDSRAGGGSQ